MDVKRLNVQFHRILKDNKNLRWIHDDALRGAIGPDVL